MAEVVRPPLPSRSSGTSGCLPTAVIIAGLLVLDFTPAFSVFDQEALGGFVHYVGSELFRQHVDTAVQSGVYASSKTDDTVKEAVRLLSLASSLTGSPEHSGRASLRLGEIQSRYLDSWSEAEASFRRAEQLLPGMIEPKYHLAKCHTELKRYGEAADKLREVLKMPRPPSSLASSGSGGVDVEGVGSADYLYSCLAPVGLATLVFGPTNAEHHIDATKRQVQIQEGDNELLSQGLSRASVVCPPALQNDVSSYRVLAQWNTPKDRKADLPHGGPPPHAFASSTKKKRSKGIAAVRKVVAGFLEFVEEAGLKELTRDLKDEPSDTVVQVGAPNPPVLQDSPASRGPSGAQPLHPGAVLNPLSFRGSRQTFNNYRGVEDGGTLVHPLANAPSQWHSGFRRLSIYDALFTRIEAIQAAVSSDFDCFHHGDVFSSYESFIENHKRKIIRLLEREHRTVLVAWKAHNTQMKALCA